MCPSQEVICQSKNGILTFCHQSKLFRLVYNNLCFELYEWELEALKAHLSEIDIDYWERQFNCAPNHRKVPLSVGAKHFMILLSKQEVNELESLLSDRKANLRILQHNDIDYTYLAN